MKKHFNNYLNKDHNFDKTTFLGILALVVVITGMFGWLYEFIFYYFNGGMNKFYWRGSNFLPWINIYATGSLMIYFLTYKRRKKPLQVFLISVISTGILEYFSGLGMYKIGNGLRCWDYNKEILNFGNINGFVCLRSVLIFGLFSLLLMYIVIPLCFYLAKKTNKKLFLTISFTLFGIFMFDELYNLIFARIMHLPRARDIYTKLGFNYVSFK
jgi:uncharacterized membrane protein